MSTVSQVPGTGQNYWRSLQELAQSDEFRQHLENEFPGGVEPAQSGFTRRRFLQIMAASAALAGVAGCRWPEEDIVPFAERPAGMTPGKTAHFATAMDRGGAGQPLLVTSFDGRPIKVDGNPDHPMSQGGASAQIQASVLDLYDPDRARNPRRRDGHRDVGTSWEDFAAFLAAERERLAIADGGGLAILATASTSPTRARLRRQLRDRYPHLNWYEHESVDDGLAREGAVRAFDRPHRDLPHLAEATIVADFDANLLVDHPAALRNAREFARRRQPDHEMNRLYVFEPGVTETGSVADHRVPTAAADIPVALGALAAEIFLGHDLAVPAGAGFTARDLAPWRGQGPAPEVTTALAEDLVAHRGHGLITVGDRQPAGAHHLVHVLNAVLDNAGRTVTYVPVDEKPPGLAELTRQLQAGKVRMLLILGGNPAGTAPVESDFAAELAKAPTSIHLCDHFNATSGLCTWRMPRSHYLENWGDAVAADGSLLAVQPLIAPLHDSRSDLELLALLSGAPTVDGYALVRQTFHRRTGGTGETPTANPRFEERWQSFLHDGFKNPAQQADTTPALDASRGLDLPRESAKLSPENLELIIKADPCLGDGRFANNAWLQELPDFATKVAWDNVAALSPGTAAALGVVHGDLVDLDFRGRKAPMPVYVLPGHAPQSVTVTLGYGRQDAGRVGRGVGHDVSALRPGDAPFGGVGLKLHRTGRTYSLACTQDHHAIDPKGYQGREERVGSLVRTGDLDHYLDHPEFVDHLGLHHPPLESLWQEKEYTGYKWGMSIDLNTCIGCNACVVACQSENNIPVVGKEEIGYSREMHWLRIDRYFKGDPENPEIAAQPVTCVHCEMAPCESVCPVAATVHTDEGLNAMVYNRCVGTRYCANNCPYKVRRFNFFNNIDDVAETTKMQFNPDVTVRSRGVMEKCSYCVQRIQNAKITAKGERRAIKDGEIVPACAQTCPTEAIVFGDLNDPESRVSKLRADHRSYDMLAFLNIKPRTSYLARIRNPHPSLVAGGETHEGDSH